MKLRRGRVGIGMVKMDDGMECLVADGGERERESIDAVVATF